MGNPLKSAWHSVRYAIDRTFKTGNRRHEFEHKYRKHGDYFGYRTNPYETLKYARTMDLMRAWRPSSDSALEIGCSVGVFTAMIAPEFKNVVAVDIAHEALGLAAETTGHAPNVSFIQSDLVSLNAGRTFGVIFCAEVLMYIPQKQGPEACAVLDRHLQGRDFVSDHGYSVADIAVYGYTHLAEEGGVSLAPHAAVQAWMARVRATPGYAAIGELLAA